MKKSSVFLAAIFAAGWLALPPMQVEAGWGWLEAWRGASGVYRSGRAIREARRNKPFRAVDQLLKYPTPFNPYPFLPKATRQKIRRTIRKINPARRYSPEYQDLFR